MTWTTDGSGLQVKRIRGRTIPQGMREYPKTRYGSICDSSLHMSELRSKRRSLAKRRGARRDERISRRYRKWDRYSLSPTTPRRTERRWMREALEGAARKLGLEVRPGEFSRDLRARIGAAQRVRSAQMAQELGATGLYVQREGETLMACVPLEREALR